MDTNAKKSGKQKKAKVAVPEVKAYEMRVTGNELIVLHEMFNSDTIGVRTNLLEAAANLKQTVLALSIKAEILMRR